MTRTTNFDHDTLAHLLQDRKLSIPDFQRSYSWTEENVDDYWNDITRAMEDQEDYFLGTVVLADIDQSDGRQFIVDGQQRIVTTALTLYSISRAVGELGKEDAQKKIFSDFIADYDLEKEKEEAKLQLSRDDQFYYDKIINGVSLDELIQESKNDRNRSNLINAYARITEQIEIYKGKDHAYEKLISLRNFLAKDAQVLLAVASGLSEAYVIFETLNDRGAALTTADLLKNFFLSSVGDHKVADALKYWTTIASNFDKSDELVKFIKADYTSRWGQVKKKDLYKALQAKLERKGDATLDYLRNLESSLKIYDALHSFDSPYWSSISEDVRDEIIAHRRFALEAPNAMFLAALRNWRPKESTKLIKIATTWSIRASLSGIMGGGTAERIYGDVAAKIDTGELKNAADVEAWFFDKNFVPSDNQFRSALLTVNDKKLSRVKYLLAKIELAYWKRTGKNVESFPSWDAKSITVEHIVANSKKIAVDINDTRSVVKEYQHALPNLTLFERSLNNAAADAEFSIKKETYRESGFELTKKLYDLDSFEDQEMEDRCEMILDLALEAWPFPHKR